MSTFQRWLPRDWRRLDELPEPLWRDTVQGLPYLSSLSGEELARLRMLSKHFLLEKDFHGAHGLPITDAMALTIAAQACLPLLYLPGPGQINLKDRPLRSLDWYGDFVGIVVQPGAAIAQREVIDASGVVHRYRETLAGEAMQGGPVMLSWAEVARSALAAETGSNVVIHEFVHKMDMRGTQLGQAADGAPDWSNACLGSLKGESARAHWRDTMSTAFHNFRDALNMAERFGGETPWLDAYGASQPAEFFAVTCEAYFVNRARFGEEFPALQALYDSFFRPGV